MSSDHRPVATIDFEASSFEGYPIEVGVAIHTPGRDHISVWSALIKPTIDWLQTMSWDPVSYQIHGISRAELKDALPAHEIARQVNTLLAPCRIAYCDGYHKDHRWNYLLMEVLGEKPAYELQTASALAYRLDFPVSALFIEDPDHPTVHRAGADAEHLLRRALNAPKNMG